MNLEQNPIIHPTKHLQSPHRIHVHSFRRRIILSQILKTKLKQNSEELFLISNIGDRDRNFKNAVSETSDIFLTTPQRYRFQYTLNKKHKNLHEVNIVNLKL